jgi:hypothetical protein
MRRNSLSVAKSAREGQMLVVDAVERLPFEEDLLFESDAQGGAEQANADDAVAVAALPQYEISIGDDASRFAILELRRQRCTIDASKPEIPEVVLDHE